MQAIKEAWQDGEGFGFALMITVLLAAVFLVPYVFSGEWTGW